jgi:hypothetical protein
MKIGSKYRVSEGPGFTRQVGASRTKAVGNPKPDILEDPLQAQIRMLRAKASDLSSNDAAARKIYAQIGDLYSLAGCLNLAGSYYKKARQFIAASNAFMGAKEYSHAARCLELAGERTFARRAYDLAARQERRNNNPALAIYAFKKAGRPAAAGEIEKKELEKLAKARKRAEERRKKAALAITSSLRRSGALLLENARKDYLKSLQSEQKQA